MMSERRQTTAPLSHAMSSSATSTSRNCDGCGLPPRLDENQAPVPLKRCSRCHQTFYHDVECQRRHFHQHKKDCMQRNAITGMNKVKKKELAAATRVEERPGRGRCLVASKSLVEGHAISTNDGFGPLVPPVLNQANRMTRCALCFGRLNPSNVFVYENNLHSRLYPVWCCSSACRRQGQPWLEHEEKNVVNMLSQTNSNLPVLPTAILLYRLLRTVAEEESNGSQPQPSSLRAKLNQLESHVNKPKSEDEEHHVQAVVTFTKRLLDTRAQFTFNATKQSILQSFSVEYLSTLVSSIKTNGFSICNGESVALGVGLFEMASNMNHSCRPNALQTFDYGKQGQLPVLRVTTCADTIVEGDEICISYIDNTCPRELRLERLKETYHFGCSCESCCSDNHDNRLVGIQCPATNCSGMAFRQEPESARECNICGNTDFTICTDLMKEFHSLQETSSDTSIKEQERLYTRIKANFSPTSWYVSEAGEQLAQSLLDALHGSNDMETQRLCTKAFQVFDELLDTPSIKDESWRILKLQVLRYKRAKLRLFLYPDPRMAIAELQDILQVASRYYPKDHEFVEGIRDTISQAFS